jgi:hypothetical protein
MLTQQVEHNHIVVNRAVGGDVLPVLRVFPHAQCSL